jgi:hypothetical protein
MLFTRVAPRTKNKVLSIGGPLLSKKLMFFTCVTPHTKSKGLPIGGPLLSKKLMFFTRVAPRTKNKGLLIGGPHIFYYFQHALHRIQKARGSIGMCAKFVILAIKFPKYFADQRVSSSFSIIQTISHQISIGGSIYFSYTAVINIQEVGASIYIYLHQVHPACKRKRLQSLGVVIVIGFDNTSKVI